MARLQTAVHVHAHTAPCTVRRARVPLAWPSVHIDSLGPRSETQRSAACCTKAVPCLPFGSLQCVRLPASRWLSRPDPTGPSPRPNSFQVPGGAARGGPGQGGHAFNYGLGGGIPGPWALGRVTAAAESCLHHGHVTIISCLVLSMWSSSSQVRVHLLL